ncbi:MAG: HigA family addiction module antidote protein [Treponema sp.]|jgi:addiction module HigA family antidote|nr:HigA family addiction module antidote protein [Treponema sp.]
MPKSATQTPGAVLQSFLDDYQLNPTILAKDISMSQSAIRQVVIGKTRISVPVALRLAKYFGNTPEYWIDVQNKYDLSEAAKDSGLAAALKRIPRAKKAAPQKAGKAAVPAKKPLPKKAAPKKAAPKKAAPKKVVRKSPASKAPASPKTEL